MTSPIGLRGHDHWSNPQTPRMAGNWLLPPARLQYVGNPPTFGPPQDPPTPNVSVITPKICNISVI